MLFSIISSKDDCLFKVFLSKRKISEHIFIFSKLWLTRKVILFFEISLMVLNIFLSEILSNALVASSNIRISAQEYLIPFYRSLNFTPVGEVYLEDDIPHIEMMHKD